MNRSNSPRRRAKIRKLFEELSDLPVSEHAAFLDHVCKDDLDLRQELASLLRHADIAAASYEDFAEEVVAPFMKFLQKNPDGMDKVMEDLSSAGSDLDDSLVGRQVSHFEILEPIGRGGMGVVYKALDNALKRKVALKFLPCNLTADPDAKARFTTEARAASSLDHPAIANIYEIGETPEHGMFIAMACYEGETLSRLVERGPLEIGQTLDIAARLADGLAKAHEKGVIHRDVKPGNVMVCEDGDIKLLDFGLAKLVNAATLTQTGVMTGTAAYMSPEQARGKTTDHRTDLWSMGAVLYEMLTGQKPFQGENAYATIFSILNEDPTPIREIRPDVDDALVDIIERCLKKDRDQRYPSAMDLLADLDAVLANAEIPSQATFARIRHTRPPIKVKASLFKIRTFRWAVACTLILGTGLAINNWISYRSSPHVTPEQIGGGPLVTSDDKSIAVLPLDNLSPDPDNAFFADGVQEDILGNLSKIRDLLVIARSSTLGFKDSDKTPKEIGEALGVRYLVEGSVRRAGDQVQVAARLIDTQTAGYTWSESYNRTLDDIFEIQAEVAKEIAGKLKAIISPEEIAQLEYRPTENPEAYGYWVKARNILTGAGGTLNEAISYYERAVALDPDFAEAWARLAHERIYKWSMDNRQDSELYKSAHEALEQAKLKGPDLADIPAALSTFAFHEHQDIETAIDYLLKALAIDPHLFQGHTLLGNRYMWLGKLAELQYHREAAMRVDPLSPYNNHTLVNTYVARKLWDEAIALIKKNEAYSNHDVWTWKLARTRYLQTGDLKAYINAIESQPDYSENSIAQFTRSLYARDFENVLLHLSDLESEEWVPSQGPSPKWMAGEAKHLQLLAALIYFVLDDKDNWLTKAKDASDYFEERIKNPMSDPRNWSQLSICYALDGNSDRMESVMKEACEKALHSYYKYRFQAEVEMHIAMAHMVLGHHDKALSTLEAASQMKSPILIERELDLWFIFDRLKGNPRFEALLRGEILSPTVQAAQIEAVGDKSIAVLPLENLSPDPDLAFFADGVQEDILTNLSKIADIDKVIARNSTLRYRNPDRNLKEIGKALGVHYLLQGSVRRDTSQVRISVQLNEAITGSQLWAESYTRPMTLKDTLQIQSEIAQTVARQLKAFISPEDIAKLEYRPTENQEAYDLFVKYHQLTATTPGQSAERTALLKKAVELDPLFAEAWASMAMAELIRWKDSHRNDTAFYEKAHLALAEARRLRPEAAFTFYAEGIFKATEDHDLDAAIELLLRALEIDPGFSAPRSIIGVWYSGMGRLVEAQHILEELWRSDPYYVWANRNLFSVYMHRKNWEKARNLIQHNLKQGSELDGVWKFREAMVNFLQFGNKQACITAVESASGLDHREAHRMKIRAVLLKKDYDAALNLIQTGNEGESFTLFPYLRGQFYITPVDLLSALIHFELNDTDKCLQASANARNYLKGIIEKNSSTEPGAYSNLALCYALEKNRQAMESTIQKTRELTQGTYRQNIYRYQVHSEIHFAMAYLVLGDHDKALSILEAASKMDSPIFLNRELDLWFIFDPLRGNPRFDSLLKD